jgi:hypothetical protein
MSDKGKMPPALLAHFKSKAEDKEGKAESSAEEKEEGDKEKRKEAVKKARTHLEERSRSARSKSEETK